MTPVSPTRRIAARLVVGMGLALSLPLASAQRPVISSCVATPSAVAPGGTASVQVRATSPAGLPLRYIYTPTAGTVAGDGASVTYTADSAATGIITILCEARDSHESWVRSRTWIKVVAAGVASANPAQAPVATSPKTSPEQAGAVTQRAARLSGASVPAAAPAVAATLVPPLPPPHQPTLPAAKPDPAPTPAVAVDVPLPQKPPFMPAAATQPAQPSPPAPTPQRAVPLPAPAPAAAHASHGISLTVPSSLAVAKKTYIDAPDAWWKYWIPAGGLCVLLVALRARAIRRRKREQARTAHHKVYVSDWS